jgi:hypothetical protein
MTLWSHPACKCSTKLIALSSLFRLASLPPGFHFLSLAGPVGRCYRRQYLVKPPPLLEERFGERRRRGCRVRLPFLVLMAIGIVAHTSDDDRRKVIPYSGTFHLKAITSSSAAIRSRCGPDFMTTSPEAMSPKCTASFKASFTWFVVNKVCRSCSSRLRVTS